MYTEFYRLRGLPFQLTPDPRFFFSSAGHTRAMAHLTYGLHQAEGFIVITGEVGTGKTTLVDLLLSQLDAHGGTGENALGAPDAIAGCRAPPDRARVARQFGVNGKPLDAQAHALNDHDVIELAGVKMEFFIKA